MVTLSILFFASTFLIGYTYILYPLILPILKRFKKRRPEPVSEYEPSVTIVISAFNEEKNIASKLENLGQIRYPLGKIHFLFGSDGSTDKTVEILMSSGIPNLIVKAFPQRRGKAAVLNDLIPFAGSEVVVFSDANTMLAPDAVMKLVGRFEDQSIGAVCGILVLESDSTTTGGLGERSYWDYDNRMKLLESEIHTTVAANGSIYAIRKHLFIPLPTTKSVSDDIYIPLAVLSQGYRVVYRADAFAFEKTPNSVRGEFRRRSRIVTRNLYSISEFRSLLHPREGFVAFVLWSRKLVRWSVPFHLMVMIVSSSLLASHSFFFSFVFTIQVTFYLFAAVGFLLERLKVSAGVLGLPYYFVAMNAAILTGVIKYMLREQVFTWEPVR